ncbi:zinc finger protein 629-like [Polyodon spathula]|uniref:zinc finger protein 629-like n=1 Tax=Polyodon spathula TaxID=7913 RepID=UPI001B7F72DD|nr:zinc finger protein 629-like [Polyodon spathula]
MARPDEKAWADYTVHGACSVAGCSSSGYRNRELHFHAFPADQTRRSQWIAATKRDAGPAFQIKKGSTYVCSAHFRPEDYKWTPVRKSLRADAVPRVFSHCEGWEEIHSGVQTPDTNTLPSMADCATEQILCVPWLSPDVKLEPLEMNPPLLLKEEPPGATPPLLKEEPPGATPISSVKTEFEDQGDLYLLQQDELSDAGDPSPAPPGAEDSAETPEPHRCWDCARSFSTAFQLTEHRRLHTGERPYKCVQCGKMFCHLANYQQHLERHGQEPESPRPRLCPACGDTLAPQHSLEYHVAVQCQPHKCAGCKRGFSTLDGYLKHLRRYGDHRRHKCPDCGRGFKKRTYMVKHQLRCPKREPPGGAVSRRAAGRGGPQSRREPPRCPGCNRIFSSAGVFRRHRCNPFKIHCYACGSYFGCYRQYESHKHEGGTGCPGNSQEVLRRNACPRCGSDSHTFQGADPRLWVVGDGLATCRLCRKGFRFPCQLEPHHRMHESKQGEGEETGPQGTSKGTGPKRESTGADSQGEDDRVGSEGEERSSRLQGVRLEGEGQRRGIPEEEQGQREGSLEGEGPLECFDCGQLFDEAEILHEHYMQHARGEETDAPLERGGGARDCAPHPHPPLDVCTPGNHSWA